MESGAAFSNPSSGKIDQQRKILEVRRYFYVPGDDIMHFTDSC